MIDPLLLQLMQRTQEFREKTGLSTRQIGKLAKISEQQLCDFLAGRKGLSTKSICRLLQVVNATPYQLQAKLSGKVIHVEHFQHMGEEMRFANGGWVAKEGGTDDPNDSTGIDSTPTARDVDGSDDYLRQTIGFLKQQQEIYRQAIGHIDSWFANYQKARPNPAGVTGPPRSVAVNETSRTAGSRGDLFKSPEELKEHLEWLKEKRAQEELKIRLRDEITAESKGYMNARLELSKRKK